MEVYEMAVNAVFQFGLAVAVLAVALLLVCEIANSYARLRYTEERAAFIRTKRLEIERQRKDGQV